MRVFENPAAKTKSKQVWRSEELQEMVKQNRILRNTQLAYIEENQTVAQVPLSIEFNKW